MQKKEKKFFFYTSKYPSSSWQYKLSFNWVSNISSFKWVFLVMDNRVNVLIEEIYLYFIRFYC